MPIPVILDVDTGIDDALAILFAVAHPDLELLGITCVAGNTTSTNAAHNTLKVLQVAGVPSVPVSIGASRPLLEPFRPSHAHGGDALGDIGLPEAAAKPISFSAVQFLHMALEVADRPVTIVSLAPQTNLALLLRTYPDIASKIEKIVFMGGSVAGGNATDVAEFNIWHDPEAAAIVLESPVPKLMYGLDVYRPVRVDQELAEAMKVDPRPATRLAGRILDFRAPSVDGVDVANPYDGMIGDAGAVCALVDPGALRTERLPVRIEMAGRSRGQTVVDQRMRPGEDAAHGRAFGDTGAWSSHLVDVALDVDAARLASVFADAIDSLR